MKRKTAINNIVKIQERIKKSGGIISTPECSHKALIILGAWVFGSTAKGSDSPNDVDILIKYKLYSHNDSNQKNLRTNKSGFWKGFPICSQLEAFKGLTKHLKMVRLHQYQLDNHIGDINETKIMIYPRCDLNINI